MFGSPAVTVYFVNCQITDKWSLWDSIVGYLYLNHNHWLYSLDWVRSSGIYKKDYVNLNSDSDSLKLMQNCTPPHRVPGSVGSSRVSKGLVALGFCRVS